MNESREDRSAQEKATELLLESLCKSYSHLKSRTENGRLLLPAAGVTIEAAVTEIDNTYVNSAFYVSSPDFDRSLYECCAVNSTDAKTSLGMVQESFMFGLMETVLRMRSAEPPSDILFTEFAGTQHEWEVYFGDTVSIGESIDNDNGGQCYWAALREHIARRIGNQKICYVKVFAANSGDGKYIDGECRINDLRSEELSRLVYDMAAGWNNKSFATQKQFFVLRQKAETYVPYPYTEDEIMDKTEQVMKLFEKCGDEEYQDFPYALDELLGDRNLASEMYILIPEICAENAIRQISYPETLAIETGGQKLTCYKTQLSSYTGIFNGIMRTMDRNVLQDRDYVYMSYIGVSSIGNIVGEYTKQGKSLDDLSGTTITLVHYMGDGYQLR